jgi:hypothetical protein
MYGVLAPYLLAGVFRLTGVTVWAGRLLALTASCATIAILLRMARPRPIFLLAGVALFATLDPVSNNYFVQNRPDMLGLCVGVVAVIAMYQGVERRFVGLYALGSVLVVVSFFIKQTMAMTAAIPLLPLLTDRRFPRTARIAMIGAPLLSIVVSIALIRVYEPIVFYYLVDVPKQYHLRATHAASGISILLASAPVFVVCLCDWLRQFRPRIRFQSWVLSALLVTIPASVITFAKDGGAENSLLPALVAMQLFTLMYLPMLVDKKASMAIALSVLLLAGGAAALRNVGYRAVYSDYATVINDVAQLKTERVIAPEDPTIPLLAGASAGRNIYLEYDAIGWPTQMPRYLVDDLQRAEYVVDVKDWWQDLLAPATLRSLGFAVVRDYPHYTLWRKRQ